MVTLIGAGPGDSGLMTVKGVKKIMDADVVLYDRLVGRDIIAMIPDSAEKINVGKNAGNHPIPQDEINALLLSKAKDGRKVVRLKGGDPFIFGRGGEELECLKDNGIEFEVVPGVSVSAAGGAYAGIPVTHRDFTSSLHIITGHARKDGWLNIDYESLVKLDGTLVFMMSVSSLGVICKGLIEAGMDPAMPAAVVENATTEIQRKFIGTVSTLGETAKENNVKSPAVIIVGRVCTLSHKLDWFSARPLFGKKVMVTRARKGESVLSARLRELGCCVVEAPTIRIEPRIKENKRLCEAAGDIKSYNWLIFTSASAVQLFFDYLGEIRFDVRGLNHIKIAAVGTETKKSIEKYGIFVDYVPETFTGAELAKGLIGQLNKGEKILMPRAKAGGPEITELLRGTGAIVDDIAIYDTVYETEGLSEAKEMLLNKEIDIVTFTSSSTVEGFIKAFPEIDITKVNGLCIGSITEETAKKYGIKTYCAETATIEGMIEKLQEVL